MGQYMLRNYYWALALGFVGGSILACTGPAQAQTRSVSTSSSGGTGGASRTGGSSSGGSSSLGGSTGSTSLSGGGSVGSTSFSGGGGGFAGSSGMGGGGGGFAGGGGGGFAGGGGGGGFAGGGGGGFAGGGGFTGGGFTGSSTANVPTASNPFQSTYINPLALGKPGTTSTGRTSGFSAPLYTTSAASAVISTTGSRTGYGTTGGTFGGGLGGGLSSTLNQTGRRPTLFLAVPGFAMRPAAPSRLQTDLQQVLAKSSKLTTKDDLQVSMEGSLVVLRGTVADGHERNLAEMLLSMTPGVRGIRNELEVRPAALPAGDMP